MQLHEIIYKLVIKLVEKMSASDGTETPGGITVERDNQTKIVNCIGRLTLADQFQCMGNQSVTYGLSG